MIHSNPALASTRPPIRQRLSWFVCWSLFLACAPAYAQSAGDSREAPALIVIAGGLGGAGTLGRIGSFTGERTWGPALRAGLHVPIAARRWALEASLLRSLGSSIRITQRECAESCVSDTDVNVTALTVQLAASFGSSSTLSTTVLAGLGAKHQSGDEITCGPIEPGCTASSRLSESQTAATGLLGIRVAVQPTRKISPALELTYQPSSYKTGETRATAHDISVGLGLMLRLR